MFTILIMILIIAIVFSFVNWSVHLTMMKDEHIPCGWANFRTFKKYFDKIDWKFESEQFGLRNDDMFLCSKDQFFCKIIKYNNAGMKIYNPISCLLCELYAYNHWRQKVSKMKKVTQKIKVKW